MAQVRKGSIGERFQALFFDNNGQPLSLVGASQITITFQTPTGLIHPHTAAFTTDGSDGAIEFITTAAADLNEVGPWMFQGYVLLSPSVDFHGELIPFDVGPNLE